MLIHSHTLQNRGDRKRQKELVSISKEITLLSEKYNENISSGDPSKDIQVKANVDQIEKRLAELNDQREVVSPLNLISDQLLLISKKEIRFAADTTIQVSC